RALGIAECFRVGETRSVLAGVVMRRDLVVDGFAISSATIGGDDATRSIVEMHDQLKRNDINIILLGGAVISLFNIIDVDQVFKKTGVQTICVTFKESEGLEEPIKHRFPDKWQRKLRAYKKLGARERVMLKTGYPVHVRGAGIDVAACKKVLDKFTLQGGIPEPIRLAKLLAKARLDGVS
ncbi:MAG: DUF99 family protein, partial [Thaumarchaeota archaeon]|nr:DUF99 family protein [Nitrososphaerota archaeon]